MPPKNANMPSKRTATLQEIIPENSDHQNSKRSRSPLLSTQNNKKAKLDTSEDKDRLFNIDSIEVEDGIAENILLKL